MESIYTHYLIMALVALYIGRVTPFIIPEIPSLAAVENKAEKNRSVLK